MRVLGGLLVVVLLVGGYIGIESSWISNTRQTVTCTVNGKDHSVASDSSPVYRVYTDECDVLDIKDNGFTGTFNSASIYGKIQTGKKYTFVTVGQRIPFLSLFPDIIEVQAAN
jgi:hypothetical protein